MTLLSVRVFSTVELIEHTTNQWNKYTVQTEHNIC